MKIKRSEVTYPAPARAGAGVPNVRHLESVARATRRLTEIAALDSVTLYHFIFYLTNVSINSLKLSRLSYQQWHLRADTYIIGTSESKKQSVGLSLAPHFFLGT